MEVTALQKLIDFINNLSTDWEDILAKAKELKELEKQQIIDACAFGRYVHQDDRTEGEQYYNRKYGKAN